MSGILEFYFRFRIGWRPSRQKVNVYQQTIFRSYSSIHVWVITISGLEKQTSVILEFFFRLLLRSYDSNRRAIPHQVTKFRPNWATHCGVMTSYTTPTWRQGWLNTTSGLVFDDLTLFRRSKSICNQISSTYLNPRSKTQLLPVWKNERPPYWNCFSSCYFDHIIVIGVLFRIRLPNFVQIGPPAAELWRHIHFQDGGSSGSIILPVSYLMMSLSSEGQSISANQISST